MLSSIQATSVSSCRMMRSLLPSSVSTVHQYRSGKSTCSRWLIHSRMSDDAVSPCACQMTPLSPRCPSQPTSPRALWAPWERHIDSATFICSCLDTPRSPGYLSCLDHSCPNKRAYSVIRICAFRRHHPHTAVSISVSACVADCGLKSTATTQNCPSSIRTCAEGHV